MKVLKLSRWTTLCCALIVASAFISVGCSQPTDPPPEHIYNTTVHVLDSVAGSLVSSPNSTLKVYATSGTLIKTATSSSNSFGVDIDAGTYDITLDVAGRASDAKHGVVIGSGTGKKLYFVSQKQGMSTFVPAAPKIIAAAYTTDATPADGPWTAIAAGDSIDIVAVTGFKLAATSTSTIDETSWSGFGIKFDFDNLPTVFNGLMPDSLVNSYDSGTGLFTATAILFFDGPTAKVTTGSHSLCAVVYDRGNNRCETSLPVTFSTGVSSGADISAGVFSKFLVDFRSYGLSREYFGADKQIDALSPLSTGGTSYRVAVSFYFQNTVPADIPILGFTVERSTDAGTSWVSAGTVNYGALLTATPTYPAGQHMFIDTDPSLNSSDTYTYRVTAFTGTGANEKKTVGSPVSVKFLPTHTASLSTPAHGTKSVAFNNDTGTGPSYSYKISNTSLWSINVSDFYYFAPLIREKDGNLVYYGRFCFDFFDSTLWAYVPGYGWLDVVADLSPPDTPLSTYFSYSKGTITLQAALFANGYTNYLSGSPIAYKSGITYEWDIFGTGTGNIGSSSAMTASYFQKGLSTTSGGLVRSYADTYATGQQTINGWFEFTTN